MYGGCAISRQMPFILKDLFDCTANKVIQECADYFVALLGTITNLEEPLTRVIWSDCPRF